MNCDQRRRTCRSHSETWAAQVQLVGDSRWNEVFVIPEKNLKAIYRPADFSIAEDISKEIRIRARTGEYSNTCFGFTWRISGILHRFPRTFEEHAMLRIH